MTLVDAASASQAANLEPRLLDLPNEVLADILGYVLKAPAFIVSAGVPRTSRMGFFHFDEPPCSDDQPDTRVLASCKLLNTIGLLPLYEQTTNAPGKHSRRRQLKFGGLLCDEKSVGLIKTWARFVIPDGIIGDSCGFDGGNLGRGKR